MRRFLYLLLLAGAVGCSVPSPLPIPQPVPVPSPSPSPTPEPIPVVDDAGLDAAVKAALKGHRDVAEGYYGIYSALADLVTAEKSPFAKPADIEWCAEHVQPLMGRKHQEVPEFTEIVSAHLKPLAENKPLTAESRAEWSKRLRELAAACKEAL